MKVPYFSQWESMDFAPKILNKTFDLRNDPLWENSGANSKDEYATWANHICGMACLKMILAARFGNIYPTMELTRMAIEYGAYQVDGDIIKGMIYAPFVSMLSDKFDLPAKIMTKIQAKDIHMYLKRDHFFMASVHPSIRWQESNPPQKGGHLVLVIDASHNYVIFHNSSGDATDNREYITMPTEKFSLYYAERGILI
ncbi:hypothetical protein JMY81_04390 [Brenneria goodwinii]|nr:hypothetical protein [Brenneria goodwinii]MCG8160075.1 hypothetical protein [Brenneria goodwinii]MCG8164598.1 hypothetical protein [Brenneria goodwinii]MCG8170696.1 hypothetical protein [Brenneria goodwinii]MCG8174224.1 hypothetical protein [Brenneria goodwinii]